MKVFVLIDATAEDYHGDDRSVVGVFRAWEDAFAKVKETLPGAEPNPDNCWEVESVPCYERRLEIEEHDLE